jgi:hypothetical protein
MSRAFILPELARGGGPFAQQMVEGPPTQSAVCHRHPSTTGYAGGPPPQDELGEE